MMIETNRKGCEVLDKRVVVVGCNYVSNLCMARSLASAGYEVEILRVFQKKPTWKNILGSMKSESRSKYVTKYSICVTDGKDENIIVCLKRLGNTNSKALLFPNDDMTASVIDIHLNELSSMYLLPNINREQGKINELMSKMNQKQLAKKANIPVVNCNILSVREGEDKLPDAISYPCFIKANVSKTRAKRIMRMCNSEEELRAVFKELSGTPDLEILIEDYIEIKREYSMLGVSTQSCVYSPGLFVVEEGGHEDWKGVAMVGQMLPRHEMEPLLDHIDTFIASLKLEGLFDVDLIEDQNGKVYFAEINMRYGASGYAIGGSGVNLPGMFADYMFTGKEIDSSQKVDVGKWFVNEKILLDEYTKGYLSFKDVKKRMKQANIYFIKDDVDRYPYRCLQRYYLLMFANKLIKGLVNRRK